MYMYFSFVHVLSLYFLSLFIPNLPISTVIDFCLTKELMVDVQTNYQYLKLNWASKASLTQRKGRAGRVQNGRCYRLITEEFYIKFLAEQSVPEILVSVFIIRVSK